MTIQEKIESQRKKVNDYQNKFDDAIDKKDSELAKKYLSRWLKESGILDILEDCRRRENERKNQD